MILHIAPGSSWWLFAAANLILVLHIAGGTVGIISGAVALLSRKGGRWHRIAGTVFVVSMLIMATIGAATSPFLPVPSMTNIAAGTLTLYLVATGWMAGKRERGVVAGSSRISRHIWRMCAALTIASGSFFLGQQKIMPAYMRGSPWLFLPVFAPLLTMVFWLIRVRFMPRFRASSVR